MTGWDLATILSTAWALCPRFDPGLHAEVLTQGVVIARAKDKTLPYGFLPRHTRLRGIQEGLAEVVAGTQEEPDLHCAPHVQTEFFQSPKFSLFIISDRSKPSNALTWLMARDIVSISSECTGSSTG